MADFDINNWLSTGTIFGLPVVIFLVMIGMAIFILFLVISRKSKPSIKEFKALELDKETRKRYKELYKFYGVDCNKNIYEPLGLDEDKKVKYGKPFGFVIGYMKGVWQDQFKKYEPIHPNYSKEQLDAKFQSSAVEVYGTPFEKLNDDQKKNIHELAKEELRDETSTQVKGNVVRGKIEIKYSVPTFVFFMKVSKPGFLSKFLAKFIGIGWKWFQFDMDSVTFLNDRLNLNGNLDTKQYQGIFITSVAGRKHIDDIGFAVERESIMSATANQTNRVIHFNIETSKATILKEIDAKIEGDKYKHTRESNE